MPYLDKAGTEELWSKIKTNFAHNMTSSDYTSQGITISLNSGTKVSTTDSETGETKVNWAGLSTVTIPVANSNTGGIITPAQAQSINNLAKVATTGKYSDLTGTPTIDTSISSTSTNAVTNKAISTALSGKADTSHTHTKSEITDFPATLPNPSKLMIGSTGNYVEYTGDESVIIDIVGPGLTFVLSTGGVATLKHTTGAGYKHIPTGGSSGNFLAYTAAGTAKWSNIEISNVTNLQTSLDAMAPLASPTFTGTPKAPTAAAGTNTTQIATTEFVATEIATAVTGVASYGGTVANADVLLEKAYKKGNYYVVSMPTGSTWPGYENGDMFFAKVDKSGDGSMDDFDVVQANITAMTTQDIDEICTLEEM